MKARRTVGVTVTGSTGGTEAQSLEFQGVGISSTKEWITHNGKDILWLPSEHRPSCSVVMDEIIGVGIGSGRVWACNILAQYLEMQRKSMEGHRV